MPPSSAQSETSVALAESRAEGSGRLLGIGLAVAGVLCFSLRPVLIKLAYREMHDPVTLLALRMAFSLPFFLGAAVVFGRAQGQPRIAPRDGLAIAALGFAGYYLASFLDFLGLQYISAGLGRLVLFLYPTLVLLLSAAFLGEKMRPRDGAALALSYAGLALALRGTGGANPNLLLGAALVFGSGLAYSVYLVAGSAVIKRAGAARFSAYATLVACGFALLQFFITRPLAALDLPLGVYVISAIIGVVCTVLPVFMTSEALRRIGANPVAMIGALGPVSAIFLGHIGLDEAIAPGQIAGAALVIAGVLLVTLRPAARRR